MYLEKEIGNTHADDEMFGCDQLKELMQLKSKVLNAGLENYKMLNTWERMVYRQVTGQGVWRIRTITTFLEMFASSHAKIQPHG